MTSHDNAGWEAADGEELMLFFYDLPIGRTGVAVRGAHVSNLFLPGSAVTMPHRLVETPLHVLAHGQLREYFFEGRKRFELPLAPRGTPFQISVWNALTEIPYGTTRSYAQVAAAVGNARAFRAVGSANNRNPIPIVFPCHRVVGANGSLVGYAGGLEMKRQLLELEQRHR